MTQQHLNLYDAALRPARVWITPLRLALAVVAVAALLWASTEWAQRAAAAANARATQSEALLLQLAQAAANNRPDDTQALAELDQLRERLTVLQQLAQAQSSQANGRAQATALLEALAQAAPGDVWLTAAQWRSADAGNAQVAQIDLQGHLLDAKRLPVYLRRLEAQAPFAGLSLVQVQVVPAAPDAAQPHPSFVLSTRPKEPGR